MRPHPRCLAKHHGTLASLNTLCREGRLFEIQDWIADGRPLQLDPDNIPKGTRYKTALQIAIDTGQHSLSELLLRSGYRLDLEHAPLLDIALAARRYGNFDLLLEWGADINSVEVQTVLDTLQSGSRQASKW